MSFTSPLDELMGRALTFATHAHRNQTRKYTDEPYIKHPIAVSALVRTVPHNANMVCAAYLHDVVEDCGVSAEEIGALFGPEIRSMVEFLTDISKPSDGNRKVRKAIDRAHVASAPGEVQTIKVADLIDNADSIIEHDPNFARIYMVEMRRLIDALKDADPILLEEARACITDYETSLLDEALRRFEEVLPIKVGRP